MDSLAMPEAYVGLDASAEDQDEFGWLALEHLLDDWPGWSSTARPTSPSLPPSQPAPVLLPVAPIAEDYVDPFQVTPATAPSVANPSCHAASNSYTKPLRSRELTMMMRFWMEMRRTPYATLEEKKIIAAALAIPVTQVTNFCNNYRKRYLKVGQKLTSYRVHAAAAQ
jgi:hypothetical protein